MSVCRKQGGIMEHLIFYCGACLMGLLCLVSMLAVYNSNKRVMKDLEHPSEAKDRWVGSFVQEHQKLLKADTEIHNPSVYVMNRMRGRKIGPWSIRRIKGISWGTFILSFFLFAAQILSVMQKGPVHIKIPLLGQAVTGMNLAVITGAGMGIVLLAVRLMCGTGYQEEVIESCLLDYVENRWKEPARIISLENVRNAGGKENKNMKKKEQTNAEEREKEKAAKQMEQGILEAAATDRRYSHLLNKEEEEIVKDVIREFLT